jgi:hypothetical protein
MTYSLYLASGDVGTSHTFTSPTFTNFTPGEPLWLSYHIKATRVTGAGVATLRAELLWFDAAGGSLTSTYADVAIDASIPETLKQFKMLPPTGAKSGNCRFTVTPAASPMQHNLWLTKVRLGKTELAATNGAVWGSNLSGIPANLAALTGVEGILNSAILSSIASDNILSASEKINDLVSKAAGLETAWNSMVTRADALGVSHATLDFVRANWKYLLNSYNPKWNDTTQDTSIYTSALPSARQVFPDGWTASGTTTAANGVYTTVTDSDGTQFRDLYADGIAVGAGQIITAGVAIKKSATHTVNWGLLRIYLNGGGYLDLVFNPYTAEARLGTGGLPAGSTSELEVLDLGSEWFFRLSLVNTPAGNTSAGLQLYPAVCADGDTFVNYNVAGTGSLDVLGCPYVVIGDWTKMGRHGLVGRYNQYVWALQQVANAISGVDASISNYVDGPTSATVTYDSTGTTIQQNVDLNYYLRSGTAGAVVSSGVTMTFTVLSGNVNGFTSSSGPQNITVSGGVGTLTVTSMTADTQLKITVVSAGITRTYFTTLRLVLAPPSNGSGSGGTGGSGASQTSGFTAITSSYGTYQVVSNTLNFTTGSSQTSVNVLLYLNPRMAKASDQDGPWDVLYKVQRLISGTWTDQGSVLHSNPDPYMDYDDELGMRIASSGTVNATVNVTGLSASTAYSFRIVCCLAAVDSVNTFAYPTNSASFSQIVPYGGGVFIS